MSTEEPATPAPVERRLAAIMISDVVGYSRLMEMDEGGTRTRLNALRAGFIDPAVAEKHGRVVKEMGDGLLIEFPSAVDAVECAAKIQRDLGQYNDDMAEDVRIQLRVGINLGDVLVEGNDVHGAAVNIAARLETLAEPGGICVSRTVFNHVKDKVAHGFEYAGERQVKNIAEPVSLYRVSVDAAPARRIVSRHLRRTWQRAIGIGVVAFVMAGATAYWFVGFPHAITGLSSVPELPSGPSVAVLPFDNLSGDTGQDYFAAGITEDLVAALGRFSNMSVLARNATAPFKGLSVAPEEIGRRLGARYLLAGSVRRVEDRVRVSVQLLEAATGLLLWSNRYDRTYESLFEVQDDVARNVAGALAVQLKQAEKGRAANKPTNNLDAYDHVLRGWALLRQDERSAIFRAQEMFERAIELDPDYAAAYSGLGVVYQVLVAHGRVEFITDGLERSETLAQKALALDPGSVEARRILANVHLQRAEYGLAADELQRALEINPSDSESYKELGLVHIWSGDEQKAIEWLEAARQLDPNLEPRYASVLGRAYYLSERYEDAIAIASGVLGLQPDYFMAHIVRAAAYAQLARSEDTDRAARDLLRIRPFFTIDQFALQFRDANDAAHMVDGLRKAGLPEGATRN